MRATSKLKAVDWTSDPIRARVIRRADQDALGARFAQVLADPFERRLKLAVFIATPVEHQNEYGANLSGPIKRDKLFFYGGYDGYRYLSGSLPTLQSIPTVDERAGNFSAFPAVTYDPPAQECFAGGICSKTPFPGNMIPANRISKAAQSLASYLPSPPNANIQNKRGRVPVGLPRPNPARKVSRK